MTPEINEMWLAEFLWRCYQRDELWIEAMERVEGTRPKAIAAAVRAAYSPEVGEKSGLSPDTEGANSW